MSEYAVGRYPWFSEAASDRSAHGGARDAEVDHDARRFIEQPGFRERHE
jgi:hypothetical protein